MKKIAGWSLIVVFGGGYLAGFVLWVVQTLDGYYVGGESKAALIITIVLGVIVALPVGLGVWLIRRADPPR